MNDQNPYYQENPQDPYSGGQYGGQSQQPQQPQTVYGSYGEQPVYQQPVPQPSPYQQSVQPPYPPVQNPGYGQQQAPYYAAPYPVASEPGSALAIAGFILGIISIFTSWFPFFGLIMPIVGIVLSALGRRSVSKRLLATIGLVLSIVAIVISLCVIATIFISAARSGTSTY
ncbi:MAG: hypothetical protein PVS3B3_05720 [Ktedonobacteraceae bacterium]